MNMKEIQRALGLKDDGIRGPVTTTALLKAADEGHLAVVGAPVQLELPLSSVTGLQRIIIHWTFTGYTATEQSKEHYHYIVEGRGSIVSGDMKPEDNISISDDRYAAHTIGANAGAIGVAFAAMVDAKESPFSAGHAPITHQQVDAMCRLVADLCKRYKIPLRRDTVLTHAEVERTLKIDQNGKWDVTWLPRMTKPGDAIAVGDQLRSGIEAYL